MVKEITSKDNKIIKETLKISDSSKYRRLNKKFFIEGLRLSVDAVKSDIKICNLFYTKESMNKWHDSVKMLEQKSENIYIISSQIANLLSDTKTPQGIFCICEMNDGLDYSVLKNYNKIIALENIQDPSNLGTILRTAEALGIEGVILTENCCDVYSPKVLRGSMGAVFRIPFFSFNDLTKIISELKDSTFNVYASVVDSSATAITDIAFSGKSVVVIGNEGNGLTKKTTSSCSQSVTIPMNGRSESLNASAAANIIMWEMTRERVRESYRDR